MNKPNSENKNTVSSFFEKHKTAIRIAAITVGTIAVGYLGYRYLPKMNSKVLVDSTKNLLDSVDIPEEPEELFKGVPLSKLDELAKQMYHGIGCKIDQWGFLVFIHRSNRGHQIFRPQMCVENGKLINLGGHYPNQWRSTADVFAEKANELFEFTE